MLPAAAGDRDVAVADPGAYAPPSGWPRVGINGPIREIHALGGACVGLDLLGAGGAGQGRLPERSGRVLLREAG